MGVTLYYSYVFFEIFYQSNNHQRQTNMIQFYDTMKWDYDLLLNIHETLIFQSNSPPSNPHTNTFISKTFQHYKNVWAIKPSLDFFYWYQSKVFLGLMALCNCCIKCDISPDINYITGSRISIELTILYRLLPKV